MPAHKFPPKGYRLTDHPLPHDFRYGASFDILDATKDATIITILRASEDATVGIEAVEVNPRHASFAEETGPTCAMGSIVPKISFTLRGSLSQAMLVDNEFAKVNLNMIPIYSSFLSSLDASDDKTTEDIELLLDLSHDVTAKRTEPQFGTVNLTNASTHPVNTVLETEVFGDYGLATDLTLESVAWDENRFYNALSFYTNGGMLRKVTGPKKTWTLSRDRPFLYHSMNFINPSVKRMNPYTFCGVILWSSLVGNHSFGITIDFNAADLDTVSWNCEIRFDEWNIDFDQTAQ